jgi:ESAT-6 family protein
MSGRFVVDLEQLDSVVSRLAAFEQKLERHITDVDARCGAHPRRVVWRCRCGKSGRTPRVDGRRAGDGTALAEIKAAAATAHSNYSAAIETNKQMWSWTT